MASASRDRDPQFIGGGVQSGADSVGRGGAADELMKRCAPSLVAREMPIPPRRSHRTPPGGSDTEKAEHSASRLGRAWRNGWCRPRLASGGKWDSHFGKLLADGAFQPPRPCGPICHGESTSIYLSDSRWFCFSGEPCLIQLYINYTSVKLLKTLCVSLPNC